MNSPDDPLSQALRNLAAASPKGAPPELGDRLKGAFARHHSRRRKRIAALTGSVVLGLLLAFTLLWVRPSHLRPPNLADQPRREVPTVVAKATDCGTVPATNSARATHARRQKPTVKTGNARSRSATPTVIASSDFIALPSFDPDIPIGQARMIRVELPGSDLQIIGYPVYEDLLQRRVLADVLVGQDGQPYAVRLIQTRTIH